MPDSLLSRLARAVGDAQVLVDDADTAGYLVDWRRKYRGAALAVVRPGSTAEVAEVVRLATQAGVAIVPQGGNTGLSGGATPAGQQPQLVLSTRRLDRIRRVDTDNDSITVEAGVVLQAVQEAAERQGRLFPMALAAQGSCTIGGNLATNAGGTAVLAYGTMRELTLGLEVVTAEGRVWDGLRALRKDNTGYDLKQLYLGSEGTLGVITAATLKLFPMPRARVTALLGLDSLGHAVSLLALARAELGGDLTAFETLSASCVALVARHTPAVRYPLSAPHPVVVLVESSDSEGEAHARAALERMLAAAFEAQLVADGVVAASIAQSRALWALREQVSEAQGAEGPHVKHDVALPVSRIVDFVEQADAALARSFPGCRPAWFGHLGDGNLHYNVLAAAGTDAAAFVARQDEINALVHDLVVARGGSISAEHGLGQLRRDESARYKSEIELDLMRRVKAALDPRGLMNPGKVLPPA